MKECGDEICGVPKFFLNLYLSVAVKTELFPIWNFYINGRKNWLRYPWILFYLHKKVLILRESKMRGWSQFTECSVSYSWIRNCALSSASYNSLYEFQILSLLDLGGEFIIEKCERPFFYFIIAANWDRWHAARLPGISEEACKSSKNTEKKWQREKRKTCTLP